MKRIRAIALALLILLFSTLCLTACGKGESKEKNKENNIASGEEVANHYGELAEVVLTARRLDEASKDYEDEKNKIVDKLGVTVFLLGLNLDDFVNEVLSPSNVKNSYLTNYLDAVNDYLEATFNALDVLTQLNTNYPTLSLDEVLKSLALEFKEESIIQEVSSYIVSAPFLVLSHTNTVSVALEEIIKAKDDIAVNEYNTSINLLKNLFLKGKALVLTTDISVISKVAINFMLSDKSYLSVYNLLELEEQGKLTQVSQTFTDLGVQAQDKKQAYLDFVDIIFNNYYQNLINTTYSNSFDNILELVQNSVAGTEQAYYQTLRASLARQGQALSAGILTSEQEQALVSSCKALDRHGLGYMVEKFLSLYSSLQIFAGDIICSVSATDLEACTNLTQMYLIIKDINDTEPVKVQMEGQIKTLSVAILAKNVLTAYNKNSNKNHLISAFKKAFGSELLLTTTENHLTKLSSYRPTDTVSASLAISRGESPMSEGVVSSTEETLGLIKQEWVIAKYVSDATKSAYDKLNEYLLPVYTLFEAFGGDEYLQIGKGYPIKDIFNKIIL